MTRPPAQIAAAIVVIVALLVATALLSNGTKHSAAPRDVESWFQDDNYLLYSPTPTVASTLDTLAGLGVDRLRLTVLWRNLAPNFRTRLRPPGFNATDP